jgi:glycosyltransferase involved in cell wall biosynthesis
MTDKIAVALFVRDEAADIASWIAWYYAIGIHTIFLYDDHSIDGTWDIVQSAAESFDLRCFRTDLNIGHYYNRQKDSYRDAIERSMGEFAWLGFFDSDEYLFVGPDRTVGEFLLNYNHAKAVAISWAVYGSAEHVIKPVLPIVEAFTKHSDLAFGDNDNIKSFVRPEAVGPEYLNPHRFDIDPEAYVDTTGSPAMWSHPGGFKADWREAKVMHFICRSMQHFSERLQRRFDLRDVGTKYWNHYDQNVHEDLRPLAFIEPLYKNIYAIERRCIAQACLLLSRANTGDEVHVASASIPQKLAAFRMRVAEGRHLGIERKTGRLRLVDNEMCTSSELLPVIAMTDPNPSDRRFVFLTCEEMVDLPLLLSAESRISDVQSYLTYDVAELRIGIQNPLTAQFLSVAEGIVGTTQAGIGSDEQFDLEPVVPSPYVADLIDQISAGMAHGLSCAGIGTWLQRSRGDVAPGVLSALVALLSEREKLRFKARCPVGLMPGWSMALGRMAG